MKRNDFVLLLLLGVVGGGIGRARAQMPSTAAPPSQSTPPAAPSVPSVDLTADSRLRGEEVLRVKWGRLDVILAALSKETGVSVEADAEIAARRVNLFSLPPSASAGQDMAVIARVAGLTWETTEAGGKTGYRLTLSDEQREAEERAQRNSERREEKTRAANRAALLKNLKDEIQRSRQAGQTGFGDYLAAFSDQQLGEAADSAQDHVEVISAGDQRHFRPFFLGLGPFSQLPGATQRAIRNLTTRDEYLPGAPGGNYKPAASGSDALAQCEFGLVAAGGTIQLALYNPAEDDVWVSPFDKVHGPTLSVMEAENDFNPAVVREMESEKLVSGLPAALANRKIRVPANVDRSHLAALLEFFADDVKLASASEDFLRTGTTPFYVNPAQLLPASDTFTVRDALRQMAKTFGQRMVYDKGVLYVTTLTRGRDLRAEPPAELVARLAARVKKRVPVSMGDVTSLATLSRLQLETLFRYCPAELKGTEMLFLWLRDAYPVMHLYALFTAEQRAAAEAEDGLTISAVDGDARRWYHALKVRGLPVPASELSISPVKPGRFYVRRKADEWRFAVSTRQGPSPALLSQQIRLPEENASAKKP